MEKRGKGVGGRNKHPSPFCKNKRKDWHLEFRSFIVGLAPSPLSFLILNPISNTRVFLLQMNIGYYVSLLFLVTCVTSDDSALYTCHPGVNAPGVTPAPNGKADHSLHPAQNINSQNFYLYFHVWFLLPLLFSKNPQDPNISFNSSHDR